MAHKLLTLKKTNLIETITGEAEASPVFRCSFPYAYFENAVNTIAEKMSQKRYKLIEESDLFL